MAISKLEEHPGYKSMAQYDKPRVGHPYEYTMWLFQLSIIEKTWNIKMTQDGCRQLLVSLVRQPDVMID